MMIDSETLLTPVSDEVPAGPDRRETPERVRIETFFDDDFDQAAPAEGGAATNRSARPDARTVVALVVEELRQTKDLELGVYLARGGLAIRDLGVAVAGAEVAAGLLSRYWDILHPDLASSELIGRRNICQALGAYAGFVRPMQQLAVIRHERLGEITLGDLLELAGNGPATERLGLFNAIVHGSAENEVEGVGAEAVGVLRTDLARFAGALAAIDAFFSEKGLPVNLGQSMAALAEAQKGLAVIAGAEERPIAQAETDGEGVSSPEGEKLAATPSAETYSGAVNSRQDVIRAINAICDYYARKEPASPVPLALRRARAWVEMSFLDILNDIVPGSVDDAERVLVQRTEK
jgi:type VI secretion system protein ImpA